jgi:dTDP-4-dehydrorhamnose reductase
LKGDSQVILVTGAQGMLGSDFVDEISRRMGPAAVLASDIKTLDITHREQVEEAFKNHKISFLINTAAYTDVDRAEAEREKAYRINVLGPTILSEVAKKYGTPMIHFSTDYVFDGSGNQPLTEETVPNPPHPNYYGETKLCGEQVVLKDSANLVLRVQWLYGKKRERFTSLKDKSEFTPFSDQWGAPTWTRDVVQVVLELMQRKSKGLFHFAYDDFATWSEVYAFVCEECRFQTKLIPKKLEDVRLPAKRPAYGVMSNKKLLDELQRSSLGSWKTSLREFLKWVS